MSSDESFSRREKYSSEPPEITIREEAPENLRYCVLDTVKDLGFEKLGWNVDPPFAKYCGPSGLRDIICRLLRKAPNKDNWSEFPNVWGEVQDLVNECKWFRVYDIIEAFHACFAKHDAEERTDIAKRFADSMNEFFSDAGIGWKLTNGKIVMRGPEAFEDAMETARSELLEDERPTAAGQIHEALLALSRRPEPNYRGAVMHGMGALECVARDLVGNPKATLGQVLKQHPEFLPKPLGDALPMLWGFASNEARHVEEGREPNRDEAELLVGVAATLATYLTRKHR
ncbi:MAG: hypothetical protein LAO55_19255 [Acidobacteriia bacterium]|nr:hypothetical protein [Terriglobia bacterium]